jgi:hypothetical protein
LRERPIIQIADVRKYLSGGAGAVRSAEFSEGVGRATQGFGTAVGNRRESVAQKLAAGVGGIFRTLCFHLKTSFQAFNDID